MTEDSRSPRTSGRGPMGESSDTREYEPEISKPVPGRTERRPNRGFWIDPPSPGRASMTGAAVEAAPSAAPRARKRGARKRRLLRLAVVAAVLAGIAVVLGLVISGRTVVPVLSETFYPIHYRAEIAQAADDYDLDPYLIAAVVKAESGYDPEARSSAGAVGLMQLMPETAEWVTELDTWKGGRDPVLTDPSDNLGLGACYLAFLGERFGDGTQLALAAYNAGQGTVGEWVEAAGGVEEFDLSDIPYPETRAYVQRVEHYYLLYRRIHPDLFTMVGTSSGAGTLCAAVGGDAAAGGARATGGVWAACLR